MFTGEYIEEFDADQGTKYRLVGVLVHSGQASGGHYYSYILHRFLSLFFYYISLKIIQFYKLHVRDIVLT